MKRSPFSKILEYDESLSLGASDVKGFNWQYNNPIITGFITIYSSHAYYLVFHRIAIAA